MPGAENIELRCSAVLFRQRTILLVRRRSVEADDWVLPGGTPRPGESMVACARREVREETGISAEPSGVAFVLEASDRESGLHTVDLVFVATEHGARNAPAPREPGLEPHFVPLDELGRLDLRPPLCGHLRSLFSRGLPYAPYLGNLWRPPASANDQGQSLGTASA
ncbi:MAG: NUDIX hydrolase [Actinomycetota bacterium]|nr:NUDIX hydrolase [Actinomycetota bacterium]